MKIINLIFEAGRQYVTVTIFASRLLLVIAEKSYGNIGHCDKILKYNLRSNVSESDV